MSKELIWIGQPNNETKMIGLWNNRYSVIRENVVIDISIDRQLALKLITIHSDSDADLLKVLFEVLRFENLYEGYFYETQKLEIDELDCIEQIDTWLPYYKSKQCWMVVPNLSMSCDLSDAFKNWQNNVEKLGIIHQMFLYSAYSGDLTPDVKLALILQAFEPISYDLEKNNEIKIVPHNHRNPTDTRILFQDRLYFIMLKYKDLLFFDDNLDIVSERAANLRNKVVHLDRDKKEVLTGQESGYYLEKIILMYTVLIFEMIGLEKEKYIEQIRETVQRYDTSYSHLRIR